ncbi:MAG: hypothetical protein KF819_25105 [Labilithrix sp.]|nr:hypothetical protein [Labilithrix sp.]
MLRVRGLGVLALLLCLLLAPACGKETERGVLQEMDFQTPEGLEVGFDRNEILDTASFADPDGIDAAQVQKFLHRTPYQRASFLETYQSNGVRAADAIAKAARTYRINPLILLVYAQAAQGLIGEPNYPFPPERVEYVFRCGCLQGNNCQPELAGFDRQVDCLARILRVSLERIATDAQTAAGWGPDQTSITLDNLKVTPVTEATAAIYDRTPRVAEGEAGGTWLIWNLWNVYAGGIDYAGPISGAIGGGWIGDPCQSSAGCGIESGSCAVDYPGGLCTVACQGDCPAQPDRPESFCADFKTSGGFCLQVCNPGASACREGYKCIRLKRFGAIDASDSKHVCSLD